MNTDALIRTKLQRPAIGPDILPRTQLIESLENGRHRKLTLISAPAGYGKSILASLWLEASECPGAWLSLDKNDNNLGVFLNYFIGAIRTIFPESYSETGHLLRGIQPPMQNILATSLINDAFTLPQPCLLVLDDYHLILNRDINQLIDTFIQYLPARIHLVLITRHDPSLDIGKLRAKNQVNEIRLAKLRFNEEETQQYLDVMFGGNVPPNWAPGSATSLRQWWLRP
jgi:LuxR family maltose regulon positive regulatory protein